MLLVAAAWVGTREARGDPLVRRAAFALPDWRAGTRPLRVLLMSDIHLGNAAMDGERLTRIVAQADALRPDLILLAGDYVDGHDPDRAREAARALVGPLGGLHAPFGVVAVLGNHDEDSAPAAIRAALGSARVTVLENEAVRRGPLTIVGVGDAYTQHDRPAAALASHPPEPRLFLSHSPDVAPLLPTGALLLAGHTHCGQVVVPGLGSLADGRLYRRRYRCGIVRDAGRTLVVTAGLGTSEAPVRIGAAPDLWLLMLGPAISRSRP